MSDKKPGPDIVERLRDNGRRVHHSWDCDPRQCYCGAGDLANDAADEIERLRAALQRVVDDIGHDWMHGRPVNVVALKERVFEALRG